MPGLVFFTDQSGGLIVRIGFWLSVPMIPSSVYYLTGGLGLGVMLGLVILLNFPWLRRLRMWTIVVTPLASIIGSGFLVVAPLLYQNFGRNHFLAIALINLFALGVGWMMRTNIQFFEPLLENGNTHADLLVTIDRIASIVLSLSYTIAIAFYLTLLSSFALEVLGLRSPLATRLLTSVLLLFVGVYGYLRGLHGMEGLEKIAVVVNLSIIAGLLVALAISAGYLHINGDGVSSLAEAPLSLQSLLILGGMLIIVQGFETARYLGKDYSPQERARGMLLAQLIACLVYLVFVPLAAPLASNLSQAADETAIITIVGKAAWGLAPVLSIAAIFSQFGASIADTIGAGGILEEKTKGRIQRRLGYVIISVLAGVLIWVRDVFTVLTLASRAFALYYALQALVASILVALTPDMPHRMFKRILFPLLIPSLIAIALFAIPAH